jgi:glutamine synthetase
MSDKNFAIFISNLSQTIKNSNKLEKLIEKFKYEYNLVTIIGFELEFYLTENINVQILEKYLGKKIKTEKGKNQYEIDIEPNSDVIEAINIFEHYKTLLIKNTNRLDGEINFNSKPFENDYGSSVHIHINFLDKNGANFFNIENNILHASRSIATFLLETFLVFANTNDHYNRLRVANMNPTNLSIGKNNRTTCLRIPYSLPKRIEHRLSPPDIDLYIGIYTILKSIYNGMENKNLVKQFEIIHGNAFDLQYNCIPLPKDASTSMKLFNHNYF